MNPLELTMTIPIWMDIAQWATGWQENYSPVFWLKVQQDLQNSQWTHEVGRSPWWAIILNLWFRWMHRSTAHWKKEISRLKRAEKQLFDALKVTTEKFEQYKRGANNAEINAECAFAAPNISASKVSEFSPSTNRRTKSLDGWRALLHDLLEKSFLGHWSITLLIFYSKTCYGHAFPTETCWQFGVIFTVDLIRGQTLRERISWDWFRIGGYVALDMEILNL